MMKIRKTYGPGAIRFVKSTSAIITTQANATLVEFVNQRLRWVSKSRGYRDAWVIATSAVVYFFSLSTVISLMAWAFGFTGPLLPVTLLTVKMVADFPLMASYAHFANRSRLLIWYIPLQIIYIFYVTLFGALGNILPFRWKGRELR